MIVELRGAGPGKLLADSAAMGQAVIVAASGVGDLPALGDTFRATSQNRVLTYRADARRQHGRGWLVTLNRVD